MEARIVSAFVIDPVHIDLILCAAINGPCDYHGSCGLSWRAPFVDELLDGIASGPLNEEIADLSGRALLRECVASVSCRYPDDPADRLPGVTPGFDPERYEWTDFGRRLNAIKCCKAIDCYEYQSCEHPGWRASGARAFCERLRSLLVCGMAGYEAAPWEWTLEEFERRRWDPNPLGDLP
jgi:hypothetical protein